MKTTRHGSNVFSNASKRLAQDIVFLNEVSHQIFVCASSRHIQGASHDTSEDVSEAFEGCITPSSVFASSKTHPKRLEVLSRRLKDASRWLKYVFKSSVKHLDRKLYFSTMHYTKSLLLQAPKRIQGAARRLQYSSRRLKDASRRPKYVFKSIQDARKRCS